jgi:acyl-CoA thioester hydrolase
MYSKKLYAGWSDMDFNSHMRNTAYLDKSADVRQMFLMEHGFPMEEFIRLKIGPVVMKDEVEYFREVGLQQKIDVTYVLAGQSDDGSRFLLQHEIFRADGKLSARVTSAGGWLDLNERKLIAPPPALLAAMNLLERTAAAPGRRASSGNREGRRSGGGAGTAIGWHARQSYDPLVSEPAERVRPVALRLRLHLQRLAGQRQRR